ncbi:non-ribosomal peptide synthetase [Steroidobacter cummioxidans]|uniref:non-ribosomal peptide synthetase n=1 Tax=Steroidobacter cummioxidans TaxID=1803913 RepID=UPI00137B8DB0|nr:non-ribosomal peptide synthetase [Steroidobacter cummioxidans]
MASTFTADPLRVPLEFWLDLLGIRGDVTIAPYGQLMQELLNSRSAIGTNNGGFNVVLIRLEDWIRDRASESFEGNIEQVRRAVIDLVCAFEDVAARTGATTFLVFSPSSNRAMSVYGEVFEEAQRCLLGRLHTLDRVWCWTHADVIRLYPLDRHEDSLADRIGHIPYTNEYFVALATFIARQVSARVKPQFKVIAVDCDNTLWKGICGEVGAEGVMVSPAHVRFQQMLVRQHDSGMLLCLCSKNNESDVEAVFKGREEMALREEHLVSSRINWSAKSSNLVSLAEELNLSLDSFILIDDSPLECAEVRAHCPGVLALQFPQEPEEIDHFIDHAWAFDRVGVTEEARERTRKYRENNARAKAREESGDLKRFLASLELKVNIAGMKPGQLDRVAELISRTNQFNLTTIRRGASEIATLCEEGGFECLVVHVRDRYGDYGLVGVVLFRREPTSIRVDTFVLSCRALGRGVEGWVVNELARVARSEQRTTILMSYRPTTRNAPARMFLDGTFGRFREIADSDAGEILFKIPVERAEEPLTDALVDWRVDESEHRLVAAQHVRSETPTHDWHEAAYALSHLPEIVSRVDRFAAGRRGAPIEYVATRTKTEMAIASIWSEVLGLERVSLRADFLALGGDSVLAVRVITRIAATLGLELSISDFFGGATVETIGAKLARAREASAGVQRRDTIGALPMSGAQRRLWFIDQLEGGSSAYHVPLALRIHGRVDANALGAAFDELVMRHEVLRTTFVKANDEPAQVISPRGHLELRIVDLSELAREPRDASVLAHASEELGRAFDLRVGPLIRALLLRLSEEEHVLLITMHHIISDGWSTGILIRELTTLYESHREHRADPLPPLIVQYADYAQWQREWSAGIDAQNQLSYWRRHLHGAPQMLELPTDRSRPPVQSYRGATEPFLLGRDLTARLREFSRGRNLTLAMALQSAWAILLSRLSGQTDVVVGMPVANRPRHELENLIGFFANTLAVRIRLEDDPRVEDLLSRVRDVMLDAYTNQEAPFEQVVEALQPVRRLSHNPIFQVMFVFQNTPRSTSSLPGLRLVEEEVSLTTAQFDLLLSLREVADDITGFLNYATSLFDAETIRTWLGCLRTILWAMVRQPQSTIGRLPLLDDRERQQVIDVFNRTRSNYSREKLIQEMFEDQAQRTPHRIAAVQDGRSLTYTELNNKANQLARCLMEKGIRPDGLVAIFVHKSVDMVVGLLGILKAGGAYVPLDPGYPIDRLRYMLEDAGASIVLTQKELRSALPTMSAELIVLDANPAKIERYAKENLARDECGVTASNRAYVIYTSGSTGRPKGVAMAHRSMVNLIEWHRKTFAAREDERVLQFASLSFDVAFQEILSTLCTGATLVLPREEVRKDARALLEFLVNQGVERLFVPPLMLQSLAECLGGARTPPTSLHDVITAGDQLRISPEISMFFKRLAGCRLHNHYGPTETHVVTALTLPEDPNDWPVLPTIGQPISNTRIYILDSLRQPVPTGVVGELYIGGANVARGYLNRPALTAERFLGDPFTDDLYSRMYRTGDRARWRLDGSIEYLGRNDNQVKIRGFRIELAEIEAQLAGHEQVRDVVVVAREDGIGEKRLVAYVIAVDGRALDADQLREFLRPILPEHMIPSAYVVLKQFPCSPNGKLDRRALPAPELRAYASHDYDPPQGEVEEEVARIWRELLHVEEVGRQNNFFKLGGHSLAATRAVTHIEQLFDVEVPLRVMFETPTVEGLSKFILQKIAAEVAMEAS